MSFGEELLPSKTTLKKYALPEDDWLQMFRDQDGSCPVCEREFDETRKPCIDHVHVAGFKKMVAEKKRKYVRGLVCRHCNHRLLGRFVTVENSYNVYEYLLDYQMRNNEE